MAVCLDGLGLGIGQIDMVGEAPRINGPTVGLGLALDNDVGQQLARTAACTMPKVKTQASKAFGTPGIGPIRGSPSGA